MEFRSTVPPVPPQAFWGKLSDDLTRWHSVLAHSADVASVMERLLKDDSVLLRRLVHLEGGRLRPERIRALLVFLAALHDMGKTNHGFQERRFPRPGDRRYTRADHVRVVFQSLDLPIFREGAIVAIAGSLSPFEGDPLHLFAATIAHHGRPLAAEEVPRGTNLDRLWAADEGIGRDPLREIERIRRCAMEWSGIDCIEPPAILPMNPAFTHLFAGALTLADWIGSTEEAFPLQSREVDGKRYWDQATAQADRACRRIGLIPCSSIHSVSGLELYESVFPQVFHSGSGASPTPLQEKISTMALPGPGSRLLIEAATGSGKTEAALALFARLRDAGHVSGLMFALPTRATAGAMKRRVEDALKNLYIDEAPGVTLAVGGQAPEASSGGAMEISDAGRLDEESALQNWASTHSKKFLAAEIVVGTIDQALLAALAARHAHLRLAGLSRHLLVVDEVHSHDDYMLKVLQNLLEFHGAAGGHAVLMSATLSAAARGILGSRGDDSTFTEAASRPFPALTLLEPGDDWKDEDVERQSEIRRITWELTSETKGLDAVVSAAVAGARVCVLRNLVKDAQSTIEEFVERGARELLWRPGASSHHPPYHSRYTPEDRHVLDSAARARFGKGGAAAGGTILVATQVVEQSLDVDFDFLVTDLAPVEVLLQRIGRLHRHRERDPSRPQAFKTPRVMIVGPEAAFEPKREFRGAHGWGTVYRRLPLLELTRRLILSRPEIRLPEESRSLIEWVYHDERIEELRCEEGWDPVVCEMEGKVLSEDYQARQMILDFGSTYDCNAERYRDESIVRTRIGDETIRVRLEPPVPCWYAARETAPFVDLRLDQARDAKVDLKNPILDGGAPASDGVWEYRAGPTLLRYTPGGWRFTKS